MAIFTLNSQHFMIRLLIFFLLACLMFLFNLQPIYSQGRSNFLIRPASTEQLSIILDSMITKDYFVNPNEDVEILFTFKLDSLGEVHAAHILKSKSFLEKYSYDLCSTIENYIFLEFLFRQFQYKFIGLRYVKVSFLYKSRRG
jgi:hypothetical protein